MSYSKTPSFVTQSPFSPIEHVSARLAAFGPNGEIFVSGTCVRIAHNLYVTARHVVADYLQRFGQIGMRANCSIWAIHVQKGPAYSIWQSDRVWLSPHSDLAVFHAEPYNDTAAVEDTMSVGLDLMPPLVGSRVFGFGHHSASGEIKIDANGTKHIEVNTIGAATVGEVREIHPVRRDSSRLAFPCFRVNARFDGGMSGGPLFTDTGRVCGIICSSLPASAEGEEECSYAATLWPLMGIPIDACPSPYAIVEKPYPLIELARRSVINVDGLHLVSVRASSNTAYDVVLNAP